LPINLRNLPNVAVQFNPASGNITIAHIVTSVVEEPNLRPTTTTTNSTPSPRTSSWGSNPTSKNQATPTAQGGAPMDQGDTPTPSSGDLASDVQPSAQSDQPSAQSDQPSAQSDQPSAQSNQPSAQSGNLTSQTNPPVPQSDTSSDSNPQDSSMDTTQPPTTSSSSTCSHSNGQSQSNGQSPGNGQPPGNGQAPSNGQPPSNGQATDRPRETSAVVNFMPQNTGHRDPLLPCQSFHFASLLPRHGQSVLLRGQRPDPEGQTGPDNPTTGTRTLYHGITIYT
jgi:hypothetical protein